MTEDSSSRGGRSQLFTLRIWCEELGSGRFEIRGQVRHIQTGRTGYFREWEKLHDFLLCSLTEDDVGKINGYRG